MSDNNTLLTGSIREQYIAQRFELNGDIESTVDVNNLSEEFMKSRIDFAAWYDAKYEETQELIDAIAERTNYIIEEDEYDSFIEELANHGINDMQSFEDAFQAEYEGYGERVYGEFSEQLIEDCGYTIQPEFIANCIDWEQVWYSSLRYDYNAIDFKGNTYFFRNI